MGHDIMDRGVRLGSPLGQADDSLDNGHRAHFIPLTTMTIMKVFSISHQVGSINRVLASTWLGLVARNLAPY